jgi:hypothetical protein
MGKNTFQSLSIDILSKARTTNKIKSFGGEYYKRLLGE